MAEKPTDSPLSCVLENYISLRDMYKRELLPGKSKIYHSLELLRIIFILTQITKFEEGFQKMFEGILDKMKITNFSWHDIVQVEESIKNYFYGILKEKDGSSSVRLQFSKRKSDFPDYTFLNIPEQKLPDLLSNCEESIVRLVKAHQTQKESEQDPVKREKHSFQCVICLNEKALIDIFDGGRPFYPTPIQDAEEGAPAFNDTLVYGLDGGLAEPEGKFPEPTCTPVKEEVTGGEVPSTSDIPETEKFTEHKETALDWASRNKKSYPFAQIWPKEGVESDDLTTTDLMDGKIDPTDPSTENALYEKNEARNNKQLSEVEEQSNKGVDDELENVEDGDDKEEKLPEGDKIVQPNGEIAALVREKEELGTQLEAAQNELAVLKDKCQELDKEKKLLEQKLNSPWRQEIQDVRREVNGTCNAYRTEFHTALDSCDNTLSNLREKLEAFKTEKKEYRTKIRNLEVEVAELKTSLKSVGAEFDHICSGLRRSPEQVLKERDEIAGATGYSGPLLCSSRYLLRQESDEQAAESSKPSEKKDESSRSGNKPTNLKDGDDKEFQSDQKYENMVKRFKENHQKLNDYWKENMERILRENKEGLTGQPSYALIYNDVKTEKIEVELFLVDKLQVVYEWAFENINCAEEVEPFIVIVELGEGHNRGLMTHDFKTIDIAVTHPSATKRKGKKDRIREKKISIAKGKGLPDLGADDAAVPYVSISGQKGFIYSMEKYNDELLPIALGQLVVNRVPLPNIYRICLEKNRFTWAIGIAQLVDMKPALFKSIFKGVVAIFPNC